MRHIATFLPTRRLAPAVLLLAAIGVFVQAPPAAAFTPPPCETTECPGAGPPAWSALTKAVVAALAVLEEDIYYNVIYVKDAITRLANQSSNNRQNTIESISSLGDSTSANGLSFELGRIRSNFTPQIFPSRTACGIESRRTNVIATTSLARASVGPAETINTSVLTNAPGTPGARGQLAYMTARFGTRTTQYCNPATVTPPTGIPCTATIGVDRDILPYQSIFAQSNMAAANDYTAAKDVIFNLLGDTVKDPVRGPALLRQEGQNASLRLYSEQAQANMASSILLGIVERRRNLSGTGSDLTQRAEASYTGMALQKLAEINAGQTTGQNLDSVSAMVAEDNRNMFVLRDFLEQWAAVRAVHLALEVRQNSSRNAGIASRPISN